MLFKLEFTGETPRQVVAQMRAWIADLEEANVPAAPVEQLASTGGAKRAAKPAARAEPEQIDIEEAIAAAPVKKPSPPVEPEKPVSKDELRRKLIELMHSKGEHAPTELLQAQFSVSKIGELDPSQYARCVAYADEILVEG